VAYAVASAMLAALLRPSRTSDRVIGAGLAVMWVWTGVAYHWLHFAAINKAALVFGAVFVLQGVLLCDLAVMRERLQFGGRRGPAAWIGWAFVVYAAVVYPLLGLAAGHRYPALPMFGVTPCPVVLLTVGLLLAAPPPVPRRLLVVPLAWSLIGGSAAFLLAMPQDWPLLASGVGVLFLLLRDAGGTCPVSRTLPA